MDTVYTVTALIGGTVLVFQFVLMLLGMGHHGGDLPGAHGGDFSSGHGHFGDAGGHDAAWSSHHGQLDHSHVSWFYEVLSIRTLSAAATFFGLTGATSRAYGHSTLHSLMLATAAGLTALYFVYWLFKQIFRLQHTGTENIGNAIGAEAVVYVPIPGKAAGAGKVMFRMQNRVVEYQAVTDDENRLATGEKVVIVAITNSDTVQVARAPAPKSEAVATA